MILGLMIVYGFFFVMLVLVRMRLNGCKLQRHRSGHLRSLPQRQNFEMSIDANLHLQGCGS